MIEEPTILLPTLDIATQIFTAGIVSVEVLVKHWHKRVTQVTTVVVATIVAG